MPFWRCFYHVIWTTKRRAPFLTPTNESILFDIAHDKTAALGGEVLAINTVPDHVHVAVTIPPKVAVAQWVKRVKGVSAYEINQRFPDAPDMFRWQDGYGVLTFGARNLDTIIDVYSAPERTSRTKRFDCLPGADGVVCRNVALLGRDGKSSRPFRAYGSTQALDYTVGNEASDA